MKQDFIKDVIQGMLPYLNNAQNEKLQEVLKYTLAKYEVTENQNKEKYSELNFVELFLSAKRAAPRNLLNTTRQLSKLCSVNSKKMLNT